MFVLSCICLSVLDNVLIDGIGVEKLFATAIATTTFQLGFCLLEKKYFFFIF